MDIVVRLKGFELLMSFLGHIGSVMKDLDLKDGVESIYAPVTPRMHFLLESEVFALILSNANRKILSLQPFKLTIKSE